MACTSAGASMFSDSAIRELLREAEIAARAELHGWSYDRYANTAEIVFHRYSPNQAGNTEAIRAWTWEGIDQLLDTDRSWWDKEAARWTEASA